MALRPHLTMGLPFREGVICSAAIQCSAHATGGSAVLDDRENGMLTRFAPIRRSVPRLEGVRPTWHLVTWLVVAATLIGGCASLACHPATIVVAKKDENVRLDTRPGLPRTTGAGRLEEDIVPKLVREYWVQSDRGDWYPVSEAQYRVAEPGRSIDMCL